MQKIIFFRILSFTSIVLSFTACGGNSESSDVSNENTTTKSIEGYLIDAPIANMNYQCGDIKAKTQKDGKFKCHKLPIIFRIGDIEVGTLDKITSDFKVYPQDLAGKNRDNFSDSNVLKIASFLQSLDDDGDISDTITISDNIKIDGSYKLDEMSQEEVTKLLEDSGITAVTPKDAEKHLREHTELLAHISSTPNPTVIPTPSPKVIPTPTSSPIETTILTSNFIPTTMPTSTPSPT
ncbi:MAG: hypothetical protein KAU90_11645, partial [Sulfurovaceae bacterium]|nr:hypothetical protein [Sulfurovaceae bacterium]